jgi:hypothetical protein
VEDNPLSDGKLLWMRGVGASEEGQVIEVYVK